MTTEEKKIGMLQTIARLCNWDDNTKAKFVTNAAKMNAFGDVERVYLHTVHAPENALKNAKTLIF